MHELVKVTHHEDRVTVSGRGLHEFLEVETRYNDWFPRMCEYGFVEGGDFNLLKIVQVQLEGNREVRREIFDHQLTIEMAKELAMIQRTEKGKQARQYFIELEKQWNTPEAVMARAAKMAQQILDNLHKKLFFLEEKVEQQKPKVLFADAVETSKTSILVGDLAKLIKQNGYDIGQKRLFDWMRTNDYLIKKGRSTNMPTQRAMDLGLFEVKELTVNTPDGLVFIKKTTKVTGKGQVYFINKFVKERELVNA